uniref:Uncharacterized protein n=1 Tax=Nelumbo nucifera TaxID=4432 RepID=A0A822Z4E7_NELNU|nr:TPA_asm: hypothetical protein HUJ06_013746 [Nelumbo nucifera]
MATAHSPDVFRVCSDSSLSSAELSFRELDDVFLQTQTRIWLGEVLHTRMDEGTTIADLLADGEILFQVSKVVWKLLLTKCIELRYSTAYIYEPIAYGKGRRRYTHYSKVDSFLKEFTIACLCSTNDPWSASCPWLQSTERKPLCVESVHSKTKPTGQPCLDGMKSSCCTNLRGRYLTYHQSTLFYLMPFGRYDIHKSWKAMKRGPPPPNRSYSF